MYSLLIYFDVVVVAHKNDDLMPSGIVDVLYDDMICDGGDGDAAVVVLVTGDDLPK